MILTLWRATVAFLGILSIGMMLWACGPIRDLKAECQGTHQPAYC